mgnify:CR=1 FL=1
MEKAAARLEAVASFSASMAATAPPTPAGAPAATAPPTAELKSPSAGPSHGTVRSLTPYLDKIGLTPARGGPGPGSSALAPAPDAPPSDADPRAPPSALPAEALGLLRGIQTQYNRLAGDAQAEASRQVTLKDAVLENVQRGAVEALSRAHTDLALRATAHQREIDALRAGYGAQLRDLRAEIDGLRAAHAEELRAARGDTEAERARLEEWSRAQLAALEAQRDGLLHSLAEQRKAQGEEVASQLDKLRREQAEQLATLRKLLAVEGRRLAAARQEALEARVAGGNEELRLRTELAQLAQAATAADEEARASIEASRGREAALRDRVAALEGALTAQRDAVTQHFGEAALRVERAEKSAAALKRERDALVAVAGGGLPDGAWDLDDPEFALARASSAEAEVKRLREQLNEANRRLAGYRSAGGGARPSSGGARPTSSATSSALRREAKSATRSKLGSGWRHSLSPHRSREPVWR